MMHPKMIQDQLRNCNLKENELTQKIIIPCLHKMNRAHQYRFKDIKFVGGTNELGNDIEYYEILGPDNHRCYTGIQVKKNNIDLKNATQLIRQGTDALEKDIFDYTTGHNYRCNRWILLTIGQITSPAQSRIKEEFSRYGKMISFWDGMKLTEFIQDYFYDEFIKIIGVEECYTSSQNIVQFLFDPDKCPEVVDNFSSTEWKTVQLHSVIPPTNTDCIYLTFRPHSGNGQDIMVGIRTTKDDYEVSSVYSQFSPIPIRIENGRTSCEIKLFQPDQHVRITCRGFRFIR